MELNNLSKDELIEIIHNMKSEQCKKYGLVWEHTNENINEKLSKSKLEKINELSIHTDDNLPVNYLIEGENYVSLKLLQDKYIEKINVIYIDPPYNTGNEFRYNDRIVDSNDEYKHSKWLSFMYNRLVIAHSLLSNQGVIFISIDDNELYQLKLLMDEIFGQKNFIANLIWKSGHGIKNDSKNISKNTEYILVYAKNIESKRNVIKNEVYDKSYRYPYNDNDGKGFYSYSTMYVKSGRVNYELKFPDGRVWKAPEGTFPRYSQKNAEKMVQSGQIVWESHRKHPLVKRYLNDVSEGRKFSSLLISEDVGYTMTGDKDLKNILGKVFQNPKPVKLIKKLLEISTDEDSIVLDFFAGSGTTAQAVLELNEDDGGNRKFILCTNNEVNEVKVREYYINKGLLDKNTKTAFNKFYKENKELIEDFYNSQDYIDMGIARGVTHKRIEKVIKGYTNLKGEKVKGINANLTYLKVTDN